MALLYYFFSLFIPACLAAVLIWYLLGLYLEKALDLVEFLLLLCVVLAYAGQVFVSWESGVGPVLLLLGLAFVGGVVWAQAEMRKRALRRMLAEDIIKWRRTLQADSRNLGAYEFLSEAYAAAGAYAEADQVLEWAQFLFPEERRFHELRERISRRAAEARGREKALRCPICGSRLEATALVCTACIQRQAEAPAEPAAQSAPQQWVSRGLVWVLAGVVAVSSAASVVGWLPAWVAAAVSGGALAVALWRLFPHAAA